MKDQIARLMATAGMHLRHDQIPGNPFAGVADRIVRDGWMGLDGQVVSRQDAVAFERHLEFLSTTVHMTEYADLTGVQAFPVAPETPPPGSKSYAWPEVDLILGGAKAGKGYGSLGPSADATVTKRTTPIRPYTAHYGYDIGEQQRVRLGYPIDTLKAVGARRIIENDQNNAIWYGDAEHNLPGLLTDANVVKTNVAVGAGGSRLWANKEADEIVDDVVTEVVAMVTATGGKANLAANRLSLPPSRFAQLAIMKHSSSSDLTVLEYLRLKLAAATGSGDFQITKHPECETGAGGGSDAWFNLYRFDPMVAGRIMVMPYTELAVQQVGFGYVVPCHAQSGGLAVFKPVAIRIGYGI